MGRLRLDLCLLGPSSLNLLGSPRLVVFGASCHLYADLELIPWTKGSAGRPSASIMLLLTMPFQGLFISVSLTTGYSTSFISVDSTPVFTSRPKVYNYRN